MRQYSKALVLINTQDGALDASPPNASISVSLPSNKTYTDLWGKDVRGPAISLPPVSAAILLESGL